MKRLIFLIVVIALFVGPVSAGVNDYNISLKMLGHMNQTPGHTNWFNDSSNTAKFPSPGGDAVTTTAIKKFGNASGYLDGAGDYISYSDNADWAFGTSNITFVSWLNATALPTSGNQVFLFNQRVSGTEAQQLTINNTGGTYYLDYSVVTGGATTIQVGKPIIISTNQWNQFVLIRDANNFKMYENGTQVGTTVSNTASVPDYSTVLNIGEWSGGGLYYTGYLDEMAVWKNSTAATPQIGDLYPQIDEIGFVNTTPPPLPLSANFTASPTRKP